VEPRPTLWQSPSSQHPSTDFSTSNFEDEDDVGNVADQQLQPSQWTLPLKPRGHVVHTFIGAIQQEMQ